MSYDFVVSSFLLATLNLEGTYKKQLTCLCYDLVKEQQ